MVHLIAVDDRLGKSEYERLLRWLIECINQANPFSPSGRPSAIAVGADLSAIFVATEGNSLYRLDTDGDLVRGRLCAIAVGEIDAAVWDAIVPGVERFDPCAS